MKSKLINILTSEDGSFLNEPIPLTDCHIYSRLTIDSYGNHNLPEIVQIKGLDKNAEPATIDIESATINFVYEGILIKGIRKVNMVKNKVFTQFIVGIEIQCDIEGWYIKNKN